MRGANNSPLFYNLLINSIMKKEIIHIVDKKQRLTDV